MTKIVTAWPLGGHAPGRYSGKCCDCNEMFMGDKRASRCLVCGARWANRELQRLAALTSDAPSAKTISGDAQPIADRLRRFFDAPGDARRLALDAAMMIEYLNKRPDTQNHREDGEFGEGATVRRSPVVTDETIIPALIAAYRNADRQLLSSDDISWGHRAGVRDVAVRLGVYDLFCATLNSAHDLYKTGDPDAPDVVKDRNGEVVLGMCRTCGKAEIELSEPCVEAKP